ncbi:MAG: nickel pincer cofactor biosynthesis protein LarC [Syntrophaceticus sp.]|jgi:uncharacterized protein (TIGR00299 family) protein
MRILYLDCFAGIAGDMLLGSLLDAGADLDVVKQGLYSLAIDGYTFETGKGSSHGIAATYVHIQNTDEQPHRHLQDVLELIEQGDLAGSIKEKAHKVFRRLGEAEAKVHGTTPEHIHFHEVGAIDSICDIVGCLVALDSLDIEQVICSPLPVSSGTIRCEHGLIPVPAPATLELIKGVPTRKSEIEGELVTPTGAVLATTLAHSFSTFPAMVVDKVGYGMGTRDYGFPNVLRAIIGETKEPSGGPGSLGNPDEIVVMESSIDDLNPEVYPYLVKKLLESGALDAFLTPIIMKGGRPGVLLTVLAHQENWVEVAKIIFQETSTLGFRVRCDLRRVLLRETAEVSTPFGEITVKFGRFTKDDPPVQVAPEYKDCCAAAERFSVPLKTVFNEAMSAAIRRS